MSKTQERGILYSIFVVLLVTIATISISAQPPPRGISTEAEVVEWYDGDTAVMNITLQCRVRLLDCWAPEVRGIQKPLGLKSKEHVIALCPEGSKARLFIPSTGRLQDSLTFGRVLGRVWTKNKDNKWIDVSEAMVADGFATKEKIR